jgi:hypothetical protein
VITVAAQPVDVPLNGGLLPHFRGHHREEHDWELGCQDGGAQHVRSGARRDRGEDVRCCGENGEHVVVCGEGGVIVLGPCRCRFSGNHPVGKECDRVRWQEFLCGMRHEN